MENEKNTEQEFTGQELIEKSQKFINKQASMIDSMSDPISATIIEPHITAEIMERYFRRVRLIEQELAKMGPDIYKGFGKGILDVLGGDDWVYVQNVDFWRSYIDYISSTKINVKFRISKLKLKDFFKDEAEKSGIDIKTRKGLNQLILQRLNGMGDCFARLIALTENLDETKIKKKNKNFVKKNFLDCITEAYNSFQYLSVGRDYDNLINAVNTDDSKNTNKKEVTLDVTSRSLNELINKDLLKKISNNIEEIDAQNIRRANTVFEIKTDNMDNVIQNRDVQTVPPRRKRNQKVDKITIYNINDSDSEKSDESKEGEELKNVSKVNKIKSKKIKNGEIKFLNFEEDININIYRKDKLDKKASIFKTTKNFVKKRTMPGIEDIKENINHMGDMGFGLNSEDSETEYNINNIKDDDCAEKNEEFSKKLELKTFSIKGGLKFSLDNMSNNKNSLSHKGKNKDEVKGD